jgi:hypothetical protein
VLLNVGAFALIDVPAVGRFFDPEGALWTAETLRTDECAGAQVELVAMEWALDAHVAYVASGQACTCVVACVFKCEDLVAEFDDDDVEWWVVHMKRYAIEQICPVQLRDGELSNLHLPTMSAVARVCKFRKNLATNRKDIYSRRGVRIAASFWMSSRHAG